MGHPSKATEFPVPYARVLFVSIETILLKQTATANVPIWMDTKVRPTFWYTKSQYHFLL